MAIEVEESIDIKVKCDKCNQEMTYNSKQIKNMIFIRAFCANCFNSVSVIVK